MCGHGATFFFNIVIRHGMAVDSARYGHLPDQGAGRFSLSAILPMYLPDLGGSLDAPASGNMGEHGPPRKQPFRSGRHPGHGDHRPSPSESILRFIPAFLRCSGIVSVTE